MSERAEGGVEDDDDDDEEDEEEEEEEKEVVGSEEGESCESEAFEAKCIRAATEEEREMLCWIKEARDAVSEAEEEEMRRARDC